jgi:gluconolactonase
MNRLGCPKNQAPGDAMKAINSLPLCLALVATGIACAQQPSSTFDRGTSLQAWQHPGYAARIAQCSTPPAPFRIGGAGASDEEPPAPALPVVDAIPGIVAAGAQWQLVWAWQGNNADGPIAGDNGTVLIANQDAGNVMEIDPQTSLARILHDDTNTGGAVSRSKNGALFLAMRGFGSGVLQLEPGRKVFADTINGEPFDCTGGVVNDIAADARGGVYIAVTAAGVYYANANGVITKYGDVVNANGIILSPDESTLYVTNGPKLVAFDVQANGALANQRDFAPLSGGGDGAAVDNEGRLYVAAGGSVNVISPQGDVLGLIPGPAGLHGVAFGGADKGTLFGIVFYGGWGTAAARNQVVALDVLTQGYEGRAK